MCIRDRYGVNTDRTDLSTLEWLQHLQEELMDGAVYIEKLKAELGGEKTDSRDNLKNEQKWGAKINERKSRHKCES